MANSIVKLTLESNQYERGIRQAQKSWNEFMKGIGMSVGKFTAVGAAVSAVTGVMKVAKDAFFHNQQQIEAWGRICDESKSLYNGFLDALNRGDISGYLSNMDDITTAARHAYEALEELSTFNAFNQINMQKARTGFTESVAGFRMGETSRDDVKASAEKLKNELKNRQEYEADTYRAEINRIANERGIQYGDLRKALSGDYGNFRELKEMPMTGKGQKFMPGGMFGGATVVDVATPANEVEKVAAAVQALTKEELKYLQSLGAQAERTNQEIAQVDKQTARILNPKTNTPRPKGSIGGGKQEIDYASDSIAAQEALVQNLTKQWKNASAELRDGYLQQLKEAQHELDYMTGKKQAIGPMEMAKGNINVSAGLWSDTSDLGVSIVTPLQQMENELANLIELQRTFGSTSSEAWQMFQDQIDQSREKIDEFKGIKKFQKDTEKVGNSWQDAAKGVAAAGSALQNLEDPSAKVTGIIGQAIAQIALGFATATTATAGAGPFAWIAAIAGGLATMVSTIEAIHSATGYAEGGIVRGTTYSGDKIPAMLNAGEVVLSRAAAGNLASQFSGIGMQNLHLSATVSGTQLRFVLNNESQMRGRGQYVTTNFNG